MPMARSGPFLCLVALLSGGPGEPKARLAKVPRNLETNVARGTQAAGAGEVRTCAQAAVPALDQHSVRRRVHA